MKTSAVMCLSLAALTLAACTSVGNLGIVTRSTADPATLLKSGRNFQELGPVEGESCRYFLLAIIPWGNATFSAAVNDALAQKGGDALINVTVMNSLYGFIPIYNIFTYTCTKVQGVAVRFQ